jgi:hypothetical protein
MAPAGISCGDNQNDVWRPVLVTISSSSLTSAASSPVELRVLARFRDEVEPDRSPSETTGGQVQSRLDATHLRHFGLVSSHLILCFRQVRHPLVLLKYFRFLRGRGGGSGTSSRRAASSLALLPFGLCRPRTFMARTRLAWMTLPGLGGLT